ncbi:MAG: hypothetical protein HY578_03545 [Nitrospinae bacterium]|nr:hypothetical protein [Nitrospinota bacterium]
MTIFLILVILLSNNKENVMPVATKRKTYNVVTLTKKEYEKLKKASEELDTLKAILLYEEERKEGKLKSFKNLHDLIHDLDH